MRAERLKLIACLAAGAVVPLAFAPFGLFWLAPLSYAALFWAWAGALPRRAFVLGFAHGAAGFLAGMYWIYISVHVFGQAPIVLALFLMFGLVGVLACFVGAAGWLAARFFATHGLGAWLGTLPALFVLTEWTRGWLFSGFGWLSAGYAQTDSWLAGYAPVLGLAGMSWAVVLSAGSLVAIALGPRRARTVAGAALVVLWIGGYAATGLRWTAPKSGFVSVALVQGAVPQDQKWLPEFFPETLDRYRRLTLAHADNDLVIWPEAAIPALASEVQPYLDDMSRRVTAQGGVLLLGALTTEGDVAVYNNSLLAMTDPPTLYTKRHLVPFGEYFPVPSFVRGWMRLMSLPYIDAVPGPDGQPPIAAAGERIAVTICYEDVFGAEQLHYFPDATLLVNVSNDAWFGESIAADQHLQIARLRAAEVGRYQLRATNTGITAIIDPRGQVVASLPQFEPGVLESTVQGFTGLTPYARFGNWPVVLGALLVLLAQLATTKLTMRRGT